MKASSTVMGFEALIVVVAAAMEGGRGGWSKSGFPDTRRVLRPGNKVERRLKNIQEDILLRDRSREWRVVGKWKSGGPSLELFDIVLMLFPRRDRCSRFGRAARWRTADSVEMSLCSRLNLVIVKGSGYEIVVSKLADAVSDASDGNRDATAAIYSFESAF